MKSIGIVGLPNVGKSTLFNLITKQQVVAANYPFATIDKNMGIVTIEDPLLDKLAIQVQAAEKFPAPLQFVDIAGLVAGASKGEGLGNLFLSHIREVDMILYVLRAFPDKNITHVNAEIDPLQDLEIVVTELLIRDLESVDKKLHNLQKLVRSSDKEATQATSILEKLKTDYLSQGKSAYYFLQSTIDNEAEQVKRQTVIRELFLLTAKPMVFLLNISYQDWSNETYQSQVGEWGKRLLAYVNEHLDPQANIKIIQKFDTRFVYELSELSSEEQVMMGEDLPIFYDWGEIINLVKHRLDLIFFYTGNEKDARAWPLQQGSTALDAAGEIHTDLANTFVKAQVAQVQDLLTHGSWATLKEKGLIKTVSRDYIVQNGDYMVVLTH